MLGPSLPNPKVSAIPKGEGTEGFEVRIACEIPLGAVSGPGCRTTVLEGIGPTIDKVYNQYLEPTTGSGPEYLGSWSDLYLAHLSQTNLPLYNSLNEETPLGPVNPVRASMPTTETNNVSGEDGVPDIRQLKS